MIQLSTRYTEALDYARTAHAGQVRKGTTVPYLAHLLEYIEVDYNRNRLQANASQF